MYEVIGNNIVRDGNVVAVVLPDGYLDVVEGSEKYRTQAVKELAKVGRRREDGTFVFVDETAAAEEAAGAAGTTPDEVSARPVISTVRELLRAVEAASGDPAPALSPAWGDETPEAWSYLRRHTEVYNTIRANCRIEIGHNHLEQK